MRENPSREKSEEGAGVVREGVRGRERDIRGRYEAYSDIYIVGDSNCGNFCSRSQNGSNRTGRGT